VEALSLGDRIAVMHSGTFMQVDEPMKVYDRPAAHFVGGFIGNPPMNFLTARLVDGGATVLVNETGLPIAPEVVDHLRATGQPTVWLGIRSENIDPLDVHAEGALPARVIVAEPLGSHILLTVKLGDAIVKVNAHPDSAFQSGQDVWLRLIPEKIRWMDKNTGQALN